MAQKWKDELVVRASLAEQAERFDEMTEYMKAVTENANELSNDERNLLSVAYKNSVGARRSSLRIISNKELETMGSENNLTKEFRKKVETELTEICNEVLSLLDNLLIKTEISAESQVFYLKMKGDYCRYLAEIASTDDKAVAIEVSERAYEDALEICKEQLPSTHPLRLGLALNFSVFHYESRNSPGLACKLAKKAFNEALADIDSVDEDSAMIMQMLRDNLTFWAGDVCDEEDSSDGETELNLSILPEDILVAENRLSQSCWEVESQFSELQFSFNSRFQQCGKLEHDEIRATRRVRLPCLADPCDVTLIPDMRLLFVTEPRFHRIGIYNADNLKFQNWCIYPYKGRYTEEQEEQKRFCYPTNILYAKDCLFILVKKTHLLILGLDSNNHFKPLQPPIKGKFSGLAVNELGDVFTLHQDLSGGRTYVKCLRQHNVKNQKPTFQWYGDKILLSVVEKFSGWRTHSKCWFLTAKGSKLFITDTGLNKIYSVNIKTEVQDVFGYLGNNEQQLNGPTGVLTDDDGNLLVCDSGNNRLVVFSEWGEFLRVADTHHKYSTPFGLVRHENTVVTVYQGKSVGATAALVRYRTKQDSEGIVTGGNCNVSSIW